MRLYVQLGRRSAALRQYQVCVAALERELHTEPESATRALYEEILRRPRSAIDDGVTPTPAPRLIVAAPETPLVGRDAELATLQESLDRSLAGDGQLVVLLGEAGIGKSRLAAEIMTIAVSRGCEVMLGRCYETEQALPFAPWIDALRNVAIAHNDALVTGLAPVWRSELSRLLPEMGAGTSAPRSDAEPRNLFEAVVHVLQHLAAERPLVAMFEDLHWADEMSLRLLAFAGRRLAGRRAMLVATARDEDLAQVPLLGQTLNELERDERLVPVRLGPLSREDTIALASALVKVGRMPEDFAGIEEQIWRMSEGNPFVAVETVRAVRHERSSQPDARTLLPSRVYDLITQRLARLGDASRRLVAVAAVVGHRCDFALLQRASDVPELDAARAVEELVRHRVLHASGDAFEFTHDRIREVVYAELLAPHRLLLHRRIAESLEALPAGRRGADALALGTHYRAAEVFDKAARYLKEAGGAAWTRLAPADAAACFEQALEALAHVSESRATREEAFEIHFQLGRVAYFSLSDFSRALHHHRAAEALAHALGDERRRGQVLGGMLYLLSSAGMHTEASEVGERALTLGRTLDDLTLQAWTGVGLARAYFALGQYRLGIDRTRWLVALDSQTPLDASARPATLLPSVGARTWLALCLARIGEYGDAMSAADEAVSVAEGTDNAQARVWAYYTLAYIQTLRGEAAPALALLERALALCSHGELPLYYPRVLGAFGSARALDGRPDEAVELLEKAVAESRAINLHYGYASLVTALGDACLGAGRVDDADRFAREAVAVARERRERGDEGWALHLTAEIAARESDIGSATAAYRDALGVAEALEMRDLAARCHVGLGALPGSVASAPAADVRRPITLDNQDA
jgi:tetratricopeptide (TPR) repeat protein